MEQKKDVEVGRRKARRIKGEEEEQRRKRERKDKRR